MKEKTQKNRRGLLLIVLALMVAISGVLVGSLAKYVTSRVLSDQAVVAKFGLNIPNSINLFADSYTNVKADEDGKKIIAPGTEGQYRFEVSGTSEVAYQVSADVSIAYSDEWEDYAPLQFSLDGDNWLDANAFQTALSGALASETMEPNTTYSGAQTIHWRWPFYLSDSKDVQDTDMGAAAAAGNAPSVMVEIEVTAAQID